MIEILLGAKGTGKTNFPTNDSASMISKLPKYKYITYFCGGAN